MTAYDSIENKGFNLEDVYKSMKRIEKSSKLKAKVSRENMTEMLRKRQEKVELVKSNNQTLKMDAKEKYKYL